ncbi:Ldh family oxidoreductase [Opitutus sp. GAS368]|uniref:Ldh family oxidoreductase n=1 Tax=Opitutus sp. GAS368 TaxID=1882749 RepID=UPI00087DC788|nr:Ldh family oxidoreductase [Opitutus sp. GAS368]SDS49391.1 Malate/lactate/ureidoglycolate dehydrogenase, LDH2 family [Opitutus sp. GAS368]
MPHPEISPDSPLTVLRSAESLRVLCRQLLQALGAAEPHAGIVADSLVAANLRGVDSHGIQMLTTYIQQLRAGGINVPAAGHVVREDGVCLRYDGENGLGQVVADRCTDHAIRIARNLGVAVVVTSHSNHFGAGAWWGEKLARSGFIGIVMSNACPAVAPWQGRAAILGTNPLCVAVPGGGGRGRWLLDMATTTVALGKLTHAAHLNQREIPREWGFLDAAGRPTTETAAAQRGAPTPTGGYKGTALAMMVEILCAGLSGGGMTTELPVYRTGGDPLGISHTFIAIDPVRFLPAGEFESRMDRLAGLVKAAGPAPGYDEVLLAGEPEWCSQQIRERTGIPVPVKLWGKLATLAGELKVDLPPASSGS